MALLQVITPTKGTWTYHPIAVNPDAVASVVYVSPTDVLFAPSSDSDNDISAVTFKYPVCITTDPSNGHDPIMKQCILVPGHFEEIAIKLGLDEEGEIQYHIDYRNA